MDTLQIRKILDRCPLTSKITHGCFPSYMIPKIRRLPADFVVNVDSSEKGRTHWVCIYVRNQNQAYFFCPFGEPPRGHILNYLRQFRGVKRNKCMFQSIWTQVCGHYAI